PVSGWVHRITGTDDITSAAADSVRQSTAAGGQGSTLIFPADFQFADMAEDQAVAAVKESPEPADDYQPAQALERLRDAKRVVFLLG
ncbi:hypothetical protein ABTC27_19350, partial [Acinetobacter baumannii]